MERKDQTSHNSRQVKFYATHPHPCSYLAQRNAVSVFVDPRIKLDTLLYGQLVEHGFRRSGDSAYRPQCPGCGACIPVRVRVNDFRPNRSQRRNLSRNRDLTVRPIEPRFSEEMFELYHRYLAFRHPGGGMDEPKKNDFLNFLTCEGIDTVFYEFRLENNLLAVAVADQLRTALSAVYTFFDPDASTRRGLGNFAVLWQIEEAKRHRLPWLYLGYWIAESPKMAYKKQYQPLETFRNGRWGPWDEIRT